METISVSQKRQTSGSALSPPHAVTSKMKLGFRLQPYLTRPHLRHDEVSAMTDDGNCMEVNNGQESTQAVCGHVVEKLCRRQLYCRRTLLALRR